MYQELALQIAKKAHAGQVDKAGNDYILHSMTVASYMDTDTEKAVAYLHDVLEDTNITVDQLRNQFPKEIVDTVIILTRKKNKNYLNYICRVTKCRLAKKVKVADLLHNLDITRIKEPTERDFKRLEKYRNAVLYLAMHA